MRPEQFPGLVHRSPKTGTVPLLFGNDKSVITGDSHPDAPEEATLTVQQQLVDVGVRSRR